ncbi:MAG: PQQ-dependent sugar dehydrogenase [Acidobacteriota bacterium]
MLRPAYLLLSLLAFAAQEGTVGLVPIIIGGNERLAWDQAAADDAQVATFRYIAYVDGNAVSMTGQSCVRSAPGVYTCTAPLPALSIGFHTVDIAATVNGASVQSGRSNRLLLLVVRPVQERSERSARIDAASTILTSDDVRLTVTPIVTGLADPVDLAFMPDGGMIVAERGGLLRVVRDGRLTSAPAWAVFEPRSAAEQLLAVAVDTDFARTHLVYAIYTTTSAQSTLVFSLVRFRETADTFADRIVIADDVPASPDGASAALRFGPDGKLFAAFDDGGSPQAASDWSSYNGKILRLNADGSTPGDQRSYVPLYSAGYRSPRGLAWHVPSNTLWVVTQEAGAGRLNSVVSDDVRRRGAVQTAFALPAGTVPSGLAIYPNTGVVEAFRGNLLVASDEGRSLLRLRTDPLMPARITASEQLLQDRIGGIRAPVVGPDGAIYLATENTIWRLSQ